MRFDKVSLFVQNQAHFAATRRLVLDQIDQIGVDLVLGKFVQTEQNIFILKTHRSSSVQ
jgi:hypothetical protein